MRSGYPAWSHGAVRDVISTAQLRAEGFTQDELARLIRSGELTRVRRGAYTEQQPEWLAGRHRQLIMGTAGLSAPGSVISHSSAAALWGLPLSLDRLDEVQVTRPEVDSGKRRGHIHQYIAALDPSEITLRDGLPVTTLARTVVDLGRSLPMAKAVVSGDAALALGLTRGELDVGLELARGRRGVVKARRACAFLDGRSETPGESLSRVLLAQTGLPAPTLQYEVIDADGVLVGRTDFCWEDQRTIGEFDGRTKYGRLLKPGQSAEDVVYREKLREDALRDLGWQVVRWTWDDLRYPARIADRVRRAFARASGFST